jgi:predicted RNA-binding protein associated with RNAse of E/G family
MIDQLWVHKLDENGMEIWRYPARPILKTDDYIRLEARFDQDDTNVGPLLICRNDRFIETFYFERWYNIFEVFNAEATKFKGWYINIARPAWLHGEHLYAEDLALDLVVTSDGRHAVLDEEEFEGLAISPDDRQQAIMTLHTLQSEAIERSGIFTRLQSKD